MKGDTDTRTDVGSKQSQISRLRVPRITRLSWLSFVDKTKLSSIGVFRVLTKPVYLAVGVLTTAVFSSIFGMLAIGTTEFNLLLSSLPIMDKLDIMVSASIRLFTESSSLYEWLLVAVVVFQGLSFSLLAYTMRQQWIVRNRQEASSNKGGGQAGKTTAATLIATLGLGCSACGTSLLIPLVSLISTSVLFLGVVTTIIVALALLLLIYSLWSMGYLAYMFTSNENSFKKELRSE